MTLNDLEQRNSPYFAFSPTVASLVGGETGGPPRVTLYRGVAPEGKIWANLQRIVEKRGRRGKKGAGVSPRGGDTLEGDDTRVKTIKSDDDSDSDEQKKVVSFLEENKHMGDNTSCRPGCHPP